MNLFWFVSRVAHAFYSRFPIFGTLRGAVAILEQDGKFLVIERSDGFGLCFPGGTSHFKETPEETIRREVTEETGLLLSSLEFKFDFRHPKPFPTHTYVFEARGEGELRGSWEGKPRAATINELKQRVIQQQQPVVEYLQSRSSRNS